MIRKYQPSKDFDAACRIWQECGWISPDQNDVLRTFLQDRQIWVQDVNGTAECLVTATAGDMWYDGTPIPTSFIASVNSSHIARKRGLAGKLTAHAIRETVEQGAELCTLGMFEQGYYNQLGFGTGSYEHIIAFSPEQLKVSAHVPVPERLTPKHAKHIHQSRCQRMKHHGSCVLDPDSVTRAELMFSKTAFGFGYFDDTGELTHHIWFNAENMESGPYKVHWMAYRNIPQFLELLGIIKSLEDQVRLVEMVEPRWLNFQDLLNKPFTYQQMTRNSRFEHRFRAIAFWQIRICRLDRCIARVRSCLPDVSFNLKLTDPIEKYLEATDEWQGISGEYSVTLGKTSSVEKGFRPGLPTLTASVNAFSRLWLGTATAEGLKATESFDAPDKLLSQLGRVFRNPVPSPDWEY